MSREELVAECVVPAGDRCGEGAVWSAAERAVYWTDINRFLIHRFEEETEAVRTWQFEEPVVALSLTDRPGTLLAALASRLILWEPASGRGADWRFALPGYPRVRLNDGRADPLGNFWVGSMKNNVNPDGSSGEAGKGEGKLFRIAPDGSCSVWRENIGIANTLCWTPDGGTFLSGDTLENEIRAYDFDPATGAIAGERPFLAGFERGLPDGSAMDGAGRLWNCRYGGAAIVRVAPDGGVDRVIEMPVRNITTCTFGGADLRSLYVTTAASPERLAGSLFRIRVDVPGLPENRVKIGTAPFP